MFVLPFLNNRQCGLKSETAKNRLNLDHLLSSFVCLKKDIYTVDGEETDIPPFSCKFRKDSRCDLLAVANEDGDIILHDTSKGASESVVKSFAAHSNAIYDICWLPDKCQLISGSGDFRAVLWDMCHFKPVSAFKKHTQSIKSVDVCHQQSAIFATGSRDGSINVWDTRENNNAVNEKPAIHICHAHCRKTPIVNGKKQSQREAVSSVSAVAFQDSNFLASAGIADGVVKIWDLRRTYIPNPKYTPSPKYQMNYADSKATGYGCTSLVFDSVYKTLYACSTGNKIVKFDCHSYSKTVAVYEGFRCATFFVKLALSSDDQYLLCGSSDEKAYIWKTSNPGLPILQLPGHSAEVTSVSWSPYDVTKLATCGDDSTVAIWKISNMEDIDKNLIQAVAEPYSKSSKNSTPLYQDSDQSLVTTSNTSQRASLEIIQTPSKSSVRVITNFFSPVTRSPSNVQLSPKDNISPKTTNKDINGNTENVFCKVQNKSPESSQVLSPCNHTNMNNIMQSPDQTFEKPGSELRNDTPGISNSSSSIRNKENTETTVSPETLNRTNSLGQTKRKSTPHSMSSSKRSQSGGSRKTKSKNDNKQNTAAGKTIMNYFSVILSPDK